MRPSSRISRAVQRRGPVGRPTRRVSRSATISWIVRPVRRASTESGTLPSCFSSRTLQGAPRRDHRLGSVRAGIDCRPRMPDGHVSSRQRAPKSKSGGSISPARASAGDGLGHAGAGSPQGFGERSRARAVTDALKSELPSRGWHRPISAFQCERGGRNLSRQ